MVWMNGSTKHFSVSYRSLLIQSKKIGINILMPYFFHIVFLFKIQPSIPPCLVYGRHPHLPIEFNMRINSYPESHDMDSNLERNIEVFKKNSIDAITCVMTASLAAKR